MWTGSWVWASKTYRSGISETILPSGPATKDSASQTTTSRPVSALTLLASATLPLSVWTMLSLGTICGLSER
ncbi:hypothetical protein M2266_001802 [Streptomyces sp. SPB162]|nr:hypothetical protein [Streptomyces sp. SPB162]